MNQQAPVALHRLLRGSLLTLATLACSAPWMTNPGDDISSLRAILTDDAARNLNSTGRFVLGPPVGETRPILSESMVRAAAEFAARVFGPQIGGYLQAQHGSPIDFRDLRVCGPTYFARSPFVPVPDGYIEEVTYYWGSQWIVAACDRDARPAVSIAIAANAVGFAPGGHGYWEVPPNAVRLLGIPPTWDGALPVSPERAARLASAAAGARVSSVPVLILPNPISEMPQGAHWLVGMEDGVEIRGRESGVTRISAELLVGTEAIPADAMRRGNPTLFSTRPNDRRFLQVMMPAREGPQVPLTVSLRAGTSIDLEPATVARVTGHE